MNRPYKRLVTGLGTLVAVGALAVSATTSVFAFHQGYTQSTSSNPGPLNAGISITGPTGGSSITPGQTASATANFTYTAPSTPAGVAGPAAGGIASLPAGNIGGGVTQAAQNTTIGTMYQQWRHNTLTDRWFYLYAGNQNVQGTAAQQQTASVANPTFNYYHYTREQGQKTFFASNAAGATSGGQPGVLVSSAPAGTNNNGSGATGVIYINSAGTLPIASVLAMGANVPACNATTVGQRCNASLVAGLRWGLAQEGWPSGSATILEAVESVPLSAAGTGGAIQPSTAVAAGNAAIYADPWGSNGGATTLTLNNTAPAQSATGLTNVGTTTTPGARFTSTAYTFQQTLTDTNSDLNSAALIFVFTSGTQTGQWFRVAYVHGDDNDNTITAAGSGCEYESWNEAVRKSVGCALQSGNYVSSYTAAYTSGTVGGGTAGEVISHTINFSPNAVGTVNVFGRGDDYHGATTGNVLVGAISIALLPE